jgi:excisionase family DNA binding protein
MKQENSTAITFKLDDTQLSVIENLITQKVLKQIEINPDLYVTKPKTPLVFYTVDQVAGILDTSPSTIRNFIEEGKLKSYRPGRNYKISQEQLDNYLESIKS